MNVEFSGTVSVVMPAEMTIDGAKQQRILISNVSTTNRFDRIEEKVVILVKYSPAIHIEFTPGTPITVRGIYSSNHVAGLPPLVNFCHAPIGFVRYSGQVYK